MTLLIKPAGVSLHSSTGVLRWDTAGGRPFQQPWGGTTFAVGSGSGPLAAGITFGDLAKSYAYGYAWQYVSPGPQRYDGCTTMGLALPQEWGPLGLEYADGLTYDAAHAIADIDLGAAPDGADFLELTTNLTRSVTPNLAATLRGILDPWPIEITEGQQEHHEDGCCVAECLAGLARQFWVEIVGGRMLLRRSQSITDVYAAQYVKEGGDVEHEYHGLMTHFIDTRGWDTGSSHDLGGSSQCNIANTVDYTTTYIGSITVWPVNYKGND